LACGIVLILIRHYDMTSLVCLIAIDAPAHRMAEPR
jgi:hypothetical protein